MACPVGVVPVGTVNGMDNARLVSLVREGLLEVSRSAPVSESELLVLQDALGVLGRLSADVRV
jgi:hypothetical protein